MKMTKCDIRFGLSPLGIPDLDNRRRLGDEFESEIDPTAMGSEHL